MTEDTRTTKQKRLRLLQLKAKAKGVQLKSQQPEPEPEKSGTNPLRSAQGALRGVTSSLLGAGDLAAAAGDVVGNQVVLPALGRKGAPIGETFDRVRADRKQLEKETPAASLAGSVAGSFAPISRLGTLAQKAGLGLKEGKTLSNVFKTAAGAGASGAVTAGVLSGDAGDAAAGGAMGAIAGPVAGAVTRLGGAANSAARTLADKNKFASFKVLSKALSREGDRVTPQQLMRAADQHKAVTGRAPAAFELVGKRGGQDLLETIQAEPSAVEHVIDKAADHTVKLQKSLTKSIRNGKSVPAVTKLERLQDTAADNVMGKIAKKEVHFDNDAARALLDDQTVYKAMPREDKIALLEFADGEGVFTVRNVENIRQALKEGGKGVGGAAAKLREFADALTQDTADQVPEYGRYLQSFARRGEGIKGHKLGSKIREAKPTQFADDVTTASKPALGGARVGARVELADAASKSPRAAASLAKDLAENEGVARNLKIIDPEEAARLKGVAKAENRALENVASSVRGAKVQSAAQEDAAKVRDVTEMLISATGKGSAAFQTNVFTKALARLKVGPTSAKYLAEMMTDPERTEEAVALLIKHGITPSQIQKAARQASSAGGRLGGSVSEN